MTLCNNKIDTASKLGRDLHHRGEKKKKRRGKEKGEKKEGKEREREGKKGGRGKEERDGSEMGILVLEILLKNSRETTTL